MMDIYKMLEELEEYNEKVEELAEERREKQRLLSNMIVGFEDEELIRDNYLYDYIPPTCTSCAHGYVKDDVGFCIYHLDFWNTTDDLDDEDICEEYTK